MTALALTAGKTAPDWAWPLDGASWDRDPQLSAEERVVLVQAGPQLLHSSRLTRAERSALARLLGPLEQVRSCLWIPDKAGPVGRLPGDRDAAGPHRRGRFGMVGLGPECVDPCDRT